MGSDNPRDNFPASLKRTLAERSGVVCSNPKCNRTTAFPSEQDSGAVANLGRAAHIRGARRGAARYDPTQTSEERRNVENGIWLCASCADLIDKNDGDGYSVELLLEWKQQREEWVRRGGPSQEKLTEVSGIHYARGRGRVTGLEVKGKGVLIQPGTVSIAEGEGEVTGTKIGG